MRYCFVDENVDCIFGVILLENMEIYGKNICEIGFLPDITRGWPKIWHQVFYCLVFAFILFYGFWDLFITYLVLVSHVFRLHADENFIFKFLIYVLCIVSLYL